MAADRRDLRSQVPIGSRRPGFGPTMQPRPSRMGEGGAQMAEPTQFLLKPEDVPDAWYNILPDMVGAGMPPLPPIHPATHEPIGPDALAPLFPMSLLMQEASTEPWHS